MGGKRTPRPFTIGEGETLVEQGEEVSESPQIYLLLDGVLAAEIDGDVVAEIGPGAIVGERALLEGGARTSTLRAVTRSKVVGVPAESVDTAALAEVAAGHRREET
jgi:CRP-like cAMP-binding protein